MKLIEDLGMQYTTDSSRSKVHFGLYECTKCAIHFKCRIIRVKQGTNNCKKCAIQALIIASVKAKVLEASSSFTSDSNKVHNDSYDYSLVEYIDSKTEVMILCKKHGIFLQSPNSHRSGHGCPSCAAYNKSQKARETFKEDCTRIHNNMYDYSLVDYINGKTAVIIGCLIHGNFLQVAANHKNGQGCPACAVSGFDKTKSAILYYLEILYEYEVLYKIGITNLSVAKRFSNSDLAKIQVLKTWEFLLGADAYNEEQAILKEYQEFKYQGIPLLKSGNTEIFTKDILGLALSLGGELLD